MKRFLLFGIIIAIFSLAQAQNSTQSSASNSQRDPSTHVTAAEAREVGLKFLNANARTPLRSANELQLATTYRTGQGDEAFYVFNTQNGFVMVAADRCSTPILGYSDEGAFDVNTVPVQMQSYLQGFVEQIAYGQEHSLAADAHVEQQWEQVRATGQLTTSGENVARGSNLTNTAMANNRMTKSVMMAEDSAGKMVRKEVSFSDLMNGTAENSHIVMPTLPQHYRGSRSGGNGVAPLITANWDQGCYYNAQCPADTEGVCGHVPTGCVAIAMGMIMRYWGYPAHGTGTHSYTPNGYPEQTVNFAATTYDWDNMPDQLDANSTQVQIDAVSTLLWHCGVAVDMIYNSFSSETTDLAPSQAIRDFFGYCNPYYQYNDNDSIWLEEVKSSLDQGRPLLYFATDEGGIGNHTFVCDGYNSADLLHFNWGWGGNGNGYFAVGALNVDVLQFNIYNHAIFGIMPPSEFQLYYNIVEGGAEVTYERPDIFNYVSIPDTVVIPPTVEIDGTTYPVIAIGDTAFGCAINLKAIFMPNTIKTIGSDAFNSCLNLSSVNISDSLVSIGESAFLETGLKSVNFLPNTLKSIGKYAFAYSEYVTSVTIPQSVTSVGHGMFLYSPAIDTVYWNAESCEFVDDEGSTWESWSDASKLIIGEHVKYIPRYIFMAAEWQSVTIPESVESIGMFAFEYCSNLKTFNFNANHCTYASHILDGCDQLETFNIGDNVRFVPDVICVKLPSVTTINFGHSVDTILGNAFWQCSGITTISLPPSIKYIANGAFWQCTGLNTVDMSSVTNPPILGIDIFHQTPDAFSENANGRKFIIPCESYDAYCNTIGWYDEGYYDYRPSLKSVPETEIQCTVIPYDTLMGSVEIIRYASVCDSTTIFFAKANHGYRFDHWNNGSTNNPDTLLLTTDTTVIAYYAKDQFNVDGIAAASILFSNFEQSENDSLWFLKNENYVNRWYINPLEGNSRTLFISNNGGQTNSYSNVDAHSFVLAYAPIHLYAGEYVCSFDWRAEGNGYLDGYYGQSYFGWNIGGGDCLFAFLYPGDVNDIPLEYDWWLNDYYGYNYWDYLVHSIFADDLFGQQKWCRNTRNINIQEEGIYNLLFYWRNGSDANGDEREPNGFPAAIDNVVFYTLDSVRGHFIGAETVDYLDTVTLTAVPNYGFHFVGWYDGDTNSTKQVVASDNLACAALFDYNQYDVTVMSSNTAMGNVTGGGTFNYLSECLITAIPNEELVFLRWSDGNTDNPRTITVTQDSTFTAIFGTCTDMLVRDTATACESYTWNDSVYTQSGDYTQSFIISGGCDSAVVLHLTVNMIYDVTDAQTICASELPITWNGVEFTQAGTQTVTLQTVNGCDSVVTMTLETLPTFNVTDAQTICASELPYTWNGVEFTQAGIQTVTLQTINGCDSVVTMTLTVFPIPMAQITGDQHVCETEPVTLTANVGTDGISSENLHYVWFVDGQMHDNMAFGYGDDSVYVEYLYPRNEPYHFSVQVSFGNDVSCASQSGEYLVYVYPQPAVNIIATEPSLCIGGTTTIMAETTNFDDREIFYSWSVDNYCGSSYTFSPSSAGSFTYTVTATHALSGCMSVADIIIDVNNTPETPVVTADNTMICDNGTVTLTVSNPVAEATYIWYRNGILIEGATQASFVETPATVDGNARNYVYNVVASLDNSGCVSGISANTVVTVTAAPTVILADSIMCESGSMLTAIVIPAAAPDAQLVYTWYLEDSIAFSGSSDYILASEPGLYKVAVSVNGCTSESEEFFVTYHGTPQLQLTATEPSLCIGGTTTIMAETTNFDDSEIFYSWSVDNCYGSSYTFSPSSAGSFTYSVTATHALSGCMSSADIIIDVNSTPETPVVTVDNAVIFDGGQITLSVTNPIDGAVYTWYRNGMLINETYQAILVDHPITLDGETTMYSYSVFASLYNSGCVSALSANTVVTVNPTPIAVVSVDGSTVICQGDSTMLHVDVTPADYSYTYQWYMDNEPIPGATSADYIASESARMTPYTFFVVVSADGGYNFTANATEILFVPAPNVVAEISEEVSCVGGTAILTARVNGVIDNSYNFQWFRYVDVPGGISAPELVGTGAIYITDGTEVPDNYIYRVVVNSSYGCNILSDPVNFSVVDIPVVTISGLDHVCEGGVLTLDAVVNNVIAGDVPSYQWYRITNGQSVSIAGATGAIYSTSTFESGLYEYFVAVNSNFSGCGVTSAAYVVDVLEVPFVTIEGANSVFYGDSVTLTAYGANTYEWSTGDSTASITVSPTIATTYTVTGTSLYGCTGTASVVVTVNNVVPTVITGNVSNVTTGTAICGGNVTSNGGAEVTGRGVCWSTLHNPTISDAHTNDGSGSGSFASNITGLSLNTTYYVRAYATNSVGTAYGEEMSFTTLCDTDYYAFSITACGSFEWNNITYTESGVYSQTFTNVNGCDSVVTMTLETLPTFNVTDVQIICASELPIIWNGIEFTQAGTQTVTLQTINGCDSVVTMTLETLPIYNLTDVKTICASELPIIWNGIEFTQAGTQTVTLQTINGCDSVVTMTLTVIQPTTGIDVQEACDSFEWIDGVTYTESTNTPTYTLTNAAGCDSVVTLNLTINHSVTVEYSLTINENDLPFTYGDTTFMPGTVLSGDYTFNFTTADGCDSIIVLHLTVETGINNYALNASMKVYPNPTTDFVNVQLTVNDEQLGEIEIQLFDVYGRLLDVVEMHDRASLNTVQIDLSRYAQGVYFMKAVSEGKVIGVKKMVKK